MTPLKKVLIVVAILTALVALAIGLAFTASVQKWALKRAMPGAEAEHVSAGMSSAEVRNLTLVQDGAVIRVPAASAEYSAWGYLTGSGIRVGKVDARGVVVDLRNYAPTATTTESAGFDGLLSAAALPPGLQLQSADIGVEVILPSPGNPEGQRVVLSVKGGGVGAGSDAAFDYNATFTDPAKDAALSKLAASGRLAFTAAADGSMEKLTANAELQAEGEGIPKGEKIVLDASANRAAGEAESFQVGISRRGTTGADTPLVTASGAFNPASKALDGTWTVSVDSERLASVLPAESTPRFDLQGDGRFSVNSDTGTSTASGEIKGSAAGLERIAAGLESVGRIAFDAAFSMATDPNGVRIERVQARMANAQGATFLSLATLQPVSFNQETGEVSFKDSSTDLATLEVTDLPLAWAAAFVEGYKLQGGTVSGAFLVQATPTGDRVKLRAAKPFTAGPVTVSDSTQTLLEQATISASPEVNYTAERIEATISSWTLSTAAGDRIEGKARATITQGAAASTDFNVTLAGRLPAMLKPFSPVDVGTVAIDGALEGASTPEKLAVRAGRFVVKNGAGATLLSAELKQPLDLDLATMQPAVKNESAPAAGVAFGSLPLGWVEPFVPDSAFAGMVENGAIDLSLAKGGPAVATTKPVVLRGVSVSLDKKALVDRVDITWDGTAAMTGAAMSANVRTLDVRQGATQLLALKALLESNGETDPKRLRATAKGTLETNLGALLSQPAAAEWRVLEAGRVAAEFDVAAAESIKVELKADAKGLVATQDRKPLGDATVNVDARVNVGKDGEFNVPLTVVNSGRKSDVSLTGNFTQQGEKVTVNARVTGETVHLDDVSALAALAPSDGAAAPAEQAGPRNTTRDEQPVWWGADGTFDIDIKNLVGGTDKPITNLKARAVMTPDRVAIDNFSGNAAGGQVTASGALRFIAADREPYALDANFRVPGLDMATFFAAEAPGKPPMLETVVVAEGTATGRGLNLDDLMARVQGRVDVTGGKGVYRGLARQSDRVSTVTGLASAFLKGKTAQDSTQFVSDLAQYLREFHFDQVVFRATRSADFKLNIETLEFSAPNIRLIGKGTIGSDPDTPFANQVQRLEMRLGMKGEWAERVTQWQLVEGSLDDLGYARIRVPVVVGGKVGSPDPTPFWTELLKIAGQMTLQKLFGG